MINQLEALTSIRTGKVVQGTYKGIAFSGKVVEANRSFSNMPVTCFVVELSRNFQAEGFEIEDENKAVFYGSDIRQANGAILEIKKVNYSRK